MAEKHEAAFRPGDGPTPRTADREAVGRLLWEQRGGSLRPGSWDDPTLFTEQVKESWRQMADELLTSAWLAEHDADVRRAAITEVWEQAQEAIRGIQQQHADVAAKALRDAATELDDYQPETPTPSFDRMVIDWLRARADRVAAGETP